MLAPRLLSLNEPLSEPFRPPSQRPEWPPVSPHDDLKDNLAAYKILSAAQAAGWDTQLTPCWSATGSGGMGYHFGNADLIDGTPDLDNPEAFMYEPQADGSMKLVGRMGCTRRGILT
jgi:hypothetical protein